MYHSFTMFMKVSASNINVCNTYSPWTLNFGLYTVAETSIIAAKYNSLNPAYKLQFEVSFEQTEIVTNSSWGAVQSDLLCKCTDRCVVKKIKWLAKYSLVSTVQACSVKFEKKKSDDT